MADLFYPSDITKVLSNKHVVFLGGSVVRGFYRDMIWLCNSASLIPHEVTKIILQVCLTVDYQVLGCKGDKHFPDLENTVWKNGKEVSKAVKEVFHKDNRDTLLEYRGMNYVDN